MSPLLTRVLTWSSIHDMETRRVRLVISGRVQGVAYRFSARDEAESLGLVGWVRNRSDGGVEVLAEGPSDRIEELIRWCADGPPLARVKDVRVEDDPPGDELSGFEIRR